MKHFRYRGKRIRPADKDLVFRSACGIVLPVFSVVMVLLNLKTILQTDWHRLSMLDIGLRWNVPYLLYQLHEELPYIKVIGSYCVPNE